MKLFDRKNIDILEGPLLRNVLVFVFPLMLTNLLQVCYNAADMIIVGLSGVEGAIGAIGTTGALINLILNLFFGFAVGANVVVARNIGRGDRTATENAVHTAMLVAFIAGICCAVIGLIVARPILAFMGDEGHILDLATQYTTIVFCGVPFLALTNFMIAILRARGDTRTPLYILTCTGLLNVGLNLLFVLVFDMSVDGVATATAISNVVSALLLAIRLSRDESWCRLSFRKLKIEKTALKDIVRNGIPAGIQGALFSLSNMLIQSSLLGLNNTICPGGSDIIDGNAAGQNLEGFAYTATNSIYQATVTFTSQHFGARKYRRIGQVMKTCYLVTFCIALIVSGTIVLARAPLTGLYVSSELALKTAETRILICMTPYFFLAFMEAGSGTLRGLGKSLLSTTIALMGACVLRLAWVWTVFRAYPRLEILYLSYPISWGLTALVHFISAMTVRKHYMKQEAGTVAQNQ